MRPIHVIGGGLAGCEAAWQIAEPAFPSSCTKCARSARPRRTAPRVSPSSSARIRSAPTTPRPTRSASCTARCARSVRSSCARRRASGAGRRRARGRPRRLLARRSRRRFSAEPLIAVERGEIAGLPPDDWDNVIIATGPLTSPALAEAIGGLTGEDALAFFDAIAPIVHRDSIDMDVAWRQSRYDKAGPGGDGADYVNCPMSREQYEAFVDALLAAEKTEFREFEGTPYFDGCLPIEVMAERGRETLRHGPMKPVGLTNAARAEGQALRGRPAAPGQCARHAVQHGGLSDQAQIRRAGARVPPHSRAANRPNSRGSAACTATPFSIRRACSTRACGSRPRRACASPARSPAARAMSRAPRSA